MKIKSIYFIMMALLCLGTVSCGGKKTTQQANNSSEASPDKSETTTSQSQMDWSKPCALLDASFIKSTLQLADNVKLTNRENKEYGEFTCDYEWADGPKYGSVSVHYAEQHAQGYPNEQAAVKSMERVIETLSRGVKASTKVDDKKVEELMEDKPADGKVEVKFQMTFNRIDKETGFPAAWKPSKGGKMALLRSYTLLFVAKSQLIYIDINVAKSVGLSPEAAKKQAIALAKKIAG